jgi:hypothetical protein
MHMWGVEWHTNVERIHRCQAKGAYNTKIQETKNSFQKIITNRVYPSFQECLEIRLYNLHVKRTE